MKTNQNDLIISIVAIVLALGFAAFFFFTKREPSRPSDPRVVPLSTPQFQPGAVTFSNALPNAGGGGGGQAGAPGGMGGFRGNSSGQLSMGGGSRSNSSAQSAGAM